MFNSEMCGVLYSHVLTPFTTVNPLRPSNNIPLSIYITALLVSMQIKWILHCIRDLNGTVWNKASGADRIIRTCQQMVMMSSAGTTGPNTTYHSHLSESRSPASFIDIAQLTMNHRSSFIPHGQTVKRRRTSPSFPLEHVSASSVIQLHI